MKFPIGMYNNGIFTFMDNKKKTKFHSTMWTDYIFLLFRLKGFFFQRT